MQAAKRVSKEPAALHGADGTEGQDQQTQKHVSQGQGKQQEVGGSVKRFEVGHRRTPQTNFLGTVISTPAAQGQVDGQLDAQGMDCPGARPIHLVAESLGRSSAPWLRTTLIYGFSSSSLLGRVACPQQQQQQQQNLSDINN